MTRRAPRVQRAEDRAAGALLLVASLALLGIVLWLSGWMLVLLLEVQLGRLIGP